MGADVPRRWRDDLRRADVTGLTLDVYLVAARLTLPLALRSLGMRSVLRGLEATTPRASAARARISVARSEALAARLGLPSTCLFRAMARWAALRSAGLDASFVMGLRRTGGDLGHAWVEVGGVPVDEAPDGDLVVTYRFGGRARAPRD
jgi:hypothetical protein